MSLLSIEITDKESKSQNVSGSTSKWEKFSSICIFSGTERVQTHNLGLIHRE